MDWVFRDEDLVELILAYLPPSRSYALVNRACAAVYRSQRFWRTLSRRDGIFNQAVLDPMTDWRSIYARAFKHVEYQIVLRELDGSEVAYDQIAALKIWDWRELFPRVTVSVGPYGGELPQALIYTDKNRCVCAVDVYRWHHRGNRNARRTLFNVIKSKEPVIITQIFRVNRDQMNPLVNAVEHWYDQHRRLFLVFPRTDCPEVIETAQNLVGNIEPNLS